ncbi:hypothetical protein ATCC90586_007012 [Pythium insidiosum]|nr:hypothetical protein ATCC90586_007012 [Pythium insidiosum]
MRTTEALLDRETKEEQERTWIYLLHQQNPPLTRRPTAPTPATSGLIPLAPMATHTASPLVAARAAAAALHVPAPIGAHSPAPVAANATWAQPRIATASPRLPSVRQGDATSVFGSMVKLEKPQTLPPPSSLAPALTTPSAGFAFRSILSKPTMATPLALSSLAGASNGLTGFIPKRRREESEEARTPADEDNDDEEDDMSPKGSKRSCLPKKCDFPMCKNSSRILQ